MNAKNVLSLFVEPKQVILLLLPSCLDCIFQKKCWKCESTLVLTLELALNLTTFGMK